MVCRERTGVVSGLVDLNGDLVGKECARSGRNVREVVLEMGLMTGPELDETFSPANLMQPLYRGKVYAAQSQTAPLAGDPR